MVQHQSISWQRGGCLDFEHPVLLLFCFVAKLDAECQKFCGSQTISCLQPQWVSINFMQRSVASWQYSQRNRLPFGRARTSVFISFSPQGVCDETGFRSLSLGARSAISLTFMIFWCDFPIKIIKFTIFPSQESQFRQSKPNIDLVSWTFPSYLDEPNRKIKSRNKLHIIFVLDVSGAMVNEGFPDGNPVTFARTKTYTICQLVCRSGT